MDKRTKGIIMLAASIVFLAVIVWMWYEVLISPAPMTEAEMAACLRNCQIQRQLGTDCRC